MIHLYLDKNQKLVLTSWILKINKDSKKRTNKTGEEKRYYSYFTSFPQELYEFFDIKNNTIYLVKEFSDDYEIIITDKPPKLPITFVKTKLVVRRKNQSNRIPTTSFTLPKKLFNELDSAKEVQFILNPKITDKFRDKLGQISIKLIY